MKYIALKLLPNGIRPGATFEENEDVGRVLMSVGAARLAEEEPPAPAAEPAPPKTTTTKKKPAPGGRQYGRRDMQAEDSKTADVAPAADAEDEA